MEESEGWRAAWDTIVAEVTAMEALANELCMCITCGKSHGRRSMDLSGNGARVDHGWYRGAEDHHFRRKHERVNTKAVQSVADQMLTARLKTLQALLDMRRSSGGGSGTGG